jgi:hypothetical protein
MLIFAVKTDVDDVHREPRSVRECSGLRRNTVDELRGMDRRKAAIVLVSLGAALAVAGDVYRYPNSVIGRALEKFRGWYYTTAQAVTGDGERAHLRDEVLGESGRQLLHEPSTSSAGRPQATIRILSGPAAGKELPLTRPMIAVGKVGVQVAVIEKRPQGYFIRRVEGGSFPVVNGKQLDAQSHALNDHDVIELAGVKIEFYLRH